MRLLHALIFSVLVLTACSQDKENTFQYVTDSVSLLVADEYAGLTRQLRDFRDSTGSQMAILIVDSLYGETIEEYSLRTANTWGLGRAEQDDGILITVARGERSVRIEVGLGLELIIKDEIAARILREDVIPQFQQEKFYDGLRAAVVRIERLIRDNPQLVGVHPPGYSGDE